MEVELHAEIVDLRDVANDDSSLQPKYINSFIDCPRKYVNLLWFLLILDHTLSRDNSKRFLIFAYLHGQNRVYFSCF